MKVAELLTRLKDADPDAVVLLFPRYADFAETEELVDVVLIAEPWTCERHREADGTTKVIHHPASDGCPMGWDAATDDNWLERVVILSPQSGSIEARLQEDSRMRSDAVSLEDSIREQALQARRQMVANGQLLPADEFHARLGVNKKRFAHMLDDGSIFSLDVDGTAYFPAVLADPRLNCKRLQAICRIIVPAPQGSRLDFLSTPHGALGAKSPLQMLADDRDYKRLCELAKAWAAQYSRTAVRLYEGEHESEPDGVEPLFTAIAEIDPRKPLWERASEALHSHGYSWPLGPYPGVRTFTVFIERQSAGYSQPVPEARVHILANGGFIRVHAAFASGPARESRIALISKHRCVVDVAKKVVAYLRKR
ncbi:hypothetical protein LMG22037_05330 [Paraburkholderia phenoliruptrix]|uniref:Uncharacterized protein n=1 Tax=Paraburkholderia phenoliruptrix TaxID=252970 RepID=A0A6J5C747_9BURK|nr:hypothetical protein [Paraburkholderia phenoliruptrix]CAB3727992.1 hypothetical protein LMG22037_05330 [Paraburkholderia phenoliruptrix]